VLHFAFIPNGQTKDQLSAMFECIKENLNLGTTQSYFPWSTEKSNLALMCTVDNRTPLVLAVCHPAITEKIIRDLLNHMKDNSADIFNPTSPERNVYRTQICIAIQQVAIQELKSYDHLTPVLDDCDPDIFDQLLHFPCQYKNLNLLQWLIERSSTYNNRATRQTKTTKNLDLNEKNHAGYTPLLTAVFYSSINCVTYLLQVNI
jgi:hypothetical protein